MSNSIMKHIKIVMIIKQVKQPLVLKVGKLMRTKKKKMRKKTSCKLGIYDVNGKNRSEIEENIKRILFCCCIFTALKL